MDKDKLVLDAPDLLAVYMKPAVIEIAERMEIDLLASYGRFKHADLLDNRV